MVLSELYEMLQVRNLMWLGFRRPLAIVNCYVVFVQVEAKLARRLEAGLKAWTQALVSEGTSKEEVDFSMDTDAPAVAVHRLGGDPKLKVIVSIFP